MITKQNARLEVYDNRKKLSEEDFNRQSGEIFQKLFDIEDFKNAKKLFLYSSIRNEVSTELILNYAMQNNITVHYPRVQGDVMFFYKINSMDDLKKGYMGILEPLDGLPISDNKDGVIIVPGVAFDKEKSRCGYGKGFYDKYLSKHTNLVKIGICFEFQLYDSLEKDSHDILMDYIVTEKMVY